MEACSLWTTQVHPQCVQDNITAVNSKLGFVAEARQPHVSSASVALSHGLNANLLRRWIQDADPNYVGKRRQESLRINDTASSGMLPAFLPVNFPGEQPTPKSVGQCIEIEVQKGSTTVKVKWPLQASHSCLAWLREISQ